MKTHKHKLIGLQKLRMACRRSQSDIAEILGIQQCQISHMESGKADPKLSMLVRLANLFGVNIDELIDCKMEIHRQINERPDFDIPGRRIFEPVGEPLIIANGKIVRQPSPSDVPGVSSLLVQKAKPSHARRRPKAARR